MGQKINSPEIQIGNRKMQQLKGALVFHVVRVIAEMKNRTITASKPVRTSCKYILN
jgi:hypothetical protein